MAVNLGIPLMAGLLAGWTAMVTLDLRERVVGAWQSLHEAVIEQPQFTITRIDVPDVSPDLAEASIKAGALACLPKPIDVQQVLELFRIPIAMSARK